MANQALNVSIETDERFIEVDVGVVEGMYKADIKEKYPDIFEKYHTPGSKFENVCYPNGETRKQVRERVFVGLEDWYHNQQYKTIAVSSHGIMLSQILIALNIECVDVPNGAVLHIKKENNQWSVVEWL